MLASQLHDNHSDTGMQVYIILFLNLLYMYQTEEMIELGDPIL